VLLAIIAGYYKKWHWVGVSDYTYVEEGNKQKFQRGKTLWDWLQLLVIPTVLAGATLFLNDRNAKIQRETTTDNQREIAVQKYIDDLSTLLMDKHLGSSTDSVLENVARTRTLSTLRSLDGPRKSILLQFLQESQLISRDQPIVVLSGANLRDADLRNADLSRAALGETDLQGADLSVKLHPCMYHLL